MVRFLKTGRTAEQSTQDASKVRDTVTGILEDIERRGDTAVAELSMKYDRWSPASFRLSEDEIAGCVNALSPGQLDDLYAPGFALVVPAPGAWTWHSLVQGVLVSTPHAVAPGGTPT